MVILSHFSRRQKTNTILAAQFEICIDNGKARLSELNWCWNTDLEDIGYELRSQYLY